MIPRKREDFEDAICWNHPKEVDFTVKSAYKSIMREDLLRSKSYWKLIWNWTGNHGTKTFMWLCAHDKILTNKQRERRKFIIDPLCDCCKAADETVLHVLRDCPTVQDLWKMLIKPRFWTEFFNGDIVNWFQFNNKRDIGKIDSLNWKLTFGEAIRKIWFRRNA